MMRMFPCPDSFISISFYKVSISFFNFNKCNITIIYFLFCRVLAKVLSVLVRKLDKSQRPKTVRGVELHEHALRQFDTV